MQSKAAANQASALTSMRAIINAQVSYQTKNGQYAGSIPRLAAAGFIDSALGSGTKDGYWFETSASGQYSFTLNARPLVYSTTGWRSFYSDQTAVIRFNTANAPATSADPPIGNQ